MGLHAFLGFDQMLKFHRARRRKSAVARSGYPLACPLPPESIMSIDKNMEAIFASIRIAAAAVSVTTCGEAPPVPRLDTSIKPAGAGMPVVTIKGKRLTVAEMTLRPQ